MKSIDGSFFEIGYLDQLASQETAIHRLDPRAKIITTLGFLMAVVSFHKYEIAALLPFALYPIVLAASGRVPITYLGKRLLAVAPFAILVGIANPWLDRETLLNIGSVGVSGGWVSFSSILLRFLLTIGTAFILIATTSFTTICLGLQRLGVPQVLTVQFLFLYRYIFVLGEEAVRLVRARALRSFGKRGLGMKVFASLVGQLLLRTLDRAERIHTAMRCRGFDGEIRTSKTLSIGRAEVLFTLCWCAGFALFRFINIPHALGAFFTGITG